MKYDNKDIPLVLTDADKLAGKVIPPPPADGAFTAVCVHMNLHRSTYATMCLREIMKVGQNHKI